MRSNSLRFIKRILPKGKKHASMGFSLLEMAVVLVIVGALVTPAIQLYHQHQVEKDWDEIQSDITFITNALGSYRATYGRYPCPAPSDAAPGSAAYGFELNDCVATAPATGCVGGICTASNVDSGKKAVIGSLPYKTLNLHDRYSFDSFKNRYTYVVTLDQTANTTFEMSGGGIDVMDAQDLSMTLVVPKASAHFVVISHGKNGVGSTARSGVANGISCASGSAAEQENCDADAIFAGGNYDTGSFDDRVVYFSSVEPSEWQYSADSDIDIHLKNTDGFALGFTSADDLSTEPTVVVSDTGGDPSTGSIYASGRFLSDELCEEGSIAGGDCFSPMIIGGLLDTTGPRAKVGVLGGMSCYDDSGAVEDYYMTGIADSSLLCTDEVFMLCPNNQFVLSVDANGNVECGDLPGRWCTDRPTIQTTCPDVAGNEDYILPDTRSGGYQRVYNGECRRFATNYDRTWWAAEMAPFTTVREVEDLVDAVNAEARVSRNCDTPFTGRNTLVRDGFYCSDGSWRRLRAHERINLSNSTFSSPGLWSTSGSWVAETHQNNSADPQNVGENHDCWCREDFRVRTTGCPSNHTGTGILIEKHQCPQTDEHRWTLIYRNNDRCACAPGETYDYQRCHDFYNQREGTSFGYYDLRGYVRRYYRIQCIGGIPTRDPTPYRYTDGCYCSTYNSISRSTCSSWKAGTTNSWSWSSWGPFSGRTESGVRALTFSQWTCPGGGITVDNPDPHTDMFIPTPRDPRVDTPYAGTIPACECDVTRRRRIREDCPAGLEGDGMFYWQPWDCTLNSGDGGWVTDKGRWTLDRDDCHKCKWKAPTGSPETMELPYGEEVNSICFCGSDPENFCHTVVGPDENKVWSTCPCKKQSN